MALYLQQFDPAWPDERIGEWVRHFRPDVFAEAKAISDKQAHGHSLNVRAIWREEMAEAQAQAERRAESGEDEAGGSAEPVPARTQPTDATPPAKRS